MVEHRGTAALSARADFATYLNVSVLTKKFFSLRVDTPRVF